MKKGWERKKVGDIAEVQSGGTPLISNKLYWNGKIPWYSSGELNNTYTSSPERKITDDGLKNSNAKLFPKGSLLIGMYDTAALKMSILDRDASFNQAIAGVKPNNNINLLFVRLAIEVIREEILGQRRGVRQKNLSLGKIRDIEIDLPPLPEQHRIVRILDDAFASLATAQANAEKNLENGRAVFEGYLQEVFEKRGEGWMEKTLADICEISSALVDPREKDFLDFPHVGGANIESKTGMLIDLKTAREEGLISGKFVFDGGTVLYSKIRPYLMKVARPDFRGLCSADIYPLSPKAGQVERNFLFHLLLSKHFTDYAKIGSARAGMPKVNREHLFGYRLFVPPVAKQKELVTQLDTLAAETQRLARIYEQKLAAFAELKKALLHQAFNGEL